MSERVRIQDRFNVVTAPESIYSYEDDYIKVFLAGGISGCPDWQSEVIKRLKCEFIGGWEFGDPGIVIYNPRRENFDVNDISETDKQIEWEFNAINRSDIFSMYFCKDTLQPICMYELGRAVERFKHNKGLIISIESGYARTDDVLIQTELALGNSIAKPNVILLEHAHYIYKAYRREVARRRAGL